MKHFISILSSLTLFVFFSLPLSAQEKEVTLGEVVVTGTRDIQEVRKIPANVTVITKGEIEKSNSQTTVDLIRDEVGVVVRDYYGTGKKASVDIRGFGETGLLNTLVLVDGRRVNEIDLSGVDWTQIPLDQVERIEILRGAGSVLYGDNAVGGVINIITKKPEKPLSAEGGLVLGSYDYHKERGSVSGKWGRFSAIFNAGYNGTEGYRENGFLRAKDAGGKLIYQLNDGISFNLDGAFHRDDAGLPGGLNKTTYQQHRRTTLHPDDRAETDDEYVDLGLKAKLWNVGRIEADVSYRHREVASFFPSFFFDDKRNLTTWGLTPRYILETPVWTLPNKLTFGLDFYKSDSVVFSGLNRSEVTKRSTGLYLLDELSVLPGLIFSFGYRQEWVNYDIFQETPKAKDESRDKEPAYSLSLDYLFGRKSSAFLSFKRSFRFPVSDELTQSYPTFQVIPSMKPQTGYHYEAGVRHFFNDQAEASLILFRMDLDDEIFFNPTTFANENYPKTRRQGFELGLKLKPMPWLSLWGNYAYAQPLLRGRSFSGNDIPGVPRNKGSLGADLHLGKGFFINTRANLIGSRFFISDWANQVDRLDGYYTLDTNLSYSCKGLKAFVGANNLFDRKYAEYAVTNATGTSLSYYSSPERNFFGGISYIF